VLADLGAKRTGVLDEAWSSRNIAESEETPRSPSPAEVVLEPRAPSELGVLVGRDLERAELSDLLDAVRETRRARVLLLSGEAGVGKSRLLAELMGEAEKAGGTVLDGAAFEAESGHPYGAWIEALRRLPRAAVGDNLSTDLAPLLPELGKEAVAEGSRDRLFGAVVELLASRAHSAPPVVLVFDDVQWFDEASIALLHYVARMNRHRPLLIALAARSGELVDNDAMVRMVRTMRRDHLLEEMEVGPLDEAATAELVHTLDEEADAADLYARSAGNPLFALELARAKGQSTSAVPPTLTELVRDRLHRLSSEGRDVLRWGAALGHSFDTELLGKLCSLDLESLIQGLEILERHDLVRASSDGGYVFAHDVVRQVVYGGVSAPRRCLMHLQIARALGDIKEVDGLVAADIAHHASLAGEASLATQACIAAGKRCVRLFASAEAVALAKRGARLAGQLSEPERTKALLAFYQIQFAALGSKALESASADIEALAHRALDYDALSHARLGFSLLSYIRWEGGDWGDAQKSMLQAERISRSSPEPGQQVLAMAEAARCLVLIERDLGQAEALLLEAQAMVDRLGQESAAVADAVGMLRLHQNQLDEARDRFDQARALARRDRDRYGEYTAIEHAITTELQRQNFEAAKALSDDLVSIATKLQAGSEEPFARCLASLARYALGEQGAVDVLDTALDALRNADAKHRLAYVLTRSAELDLIRKDPKRARARAEEALEAAQALGRPSEIAMSRLTLVKAAKELGRNNTVELQLSELERASMLNVSRHIRGQVGNVLGGADENEEHDGEG
jgi:predicted ATPase